MQYGRRVGSSLRGQCCQMCELCNVGVRCAGCCSGHQSKCLGSSGRENEQVWL